MDLKQVLFASIITLAIILNSTLFFQEDVTTVQIGILICVEYLLLDSIKEE